jgi:hypothetical protein
VVGGDRIWWHLELRIKDTLPCTDVVITVTARKEGRMETRKETRKVRKDDGRKEGEEGRRKEGR